MARPCSRPSASPDRPRVSTVRGPKVCFGGSFGPTALIIRSRLRRRVRRLPLKDRPLRKKWDTRTVDAAMKGTTMTDLARLPDRVEIREVGPRDGLQIEEPISTEAKIRLLRALVATGVRRIEATAFVSPRAVPAMADAEAVAAFVQTVPGVEWSALVAQPERCPAGGRGRPDERSSTWCRRPTGTAGPTRAARRRRRWTRWTRSPRWCTTPAAASR